MRTHSVAHLYFVQSKIVLVGADPFFAEICAAVVFSAISPPGALSPTLTSLVSTSSSMSQRLTKVRRSADISCAYRDICCSFAEHDDKSDAARISWSNN